MPNIRNIIAKAPTFIPSCVIAVIWLIVLGFRAYSHLSFGGHSHIDYFCTKRVKKSVATYCIGHKTGQLFFSGLVVCYSLYVPTYICTYMCIKVHLLLARLVAHRVGCTLCTL